MKFEEKFRGSFISLLMYMFMEEEFLLNENSVFLFYIVVCVGYEIICVLF